MAWPAASVDTVGSQASQPNSDLFSINLEVLSPALLGQLSASGTPASAAPGARTPPDAASWAPAASPAAGPAVARQAGRGAALAGNHGAAAALTASSVTMRQATTAQAGQPRPEAGASSTSFDSQSGKAANRCVLSSVSASAMATIAEVGDENAAEAAPGGGSAAASAKGKAGPAAVGHSSGRPARGTRTSSNAVRHRAAAPLKAGGAAAAAAKPVAAAAGTALTSLARLGGGAAPALANGAHVGKTGAQQQGASSARSSASIDARGSGPAPAAGPGANSRHAASSSGPAQRTGSLRGSGSHAPAEEGVGESGDNFSTAAMLRGSGPAPGASAAPPTRPAASHDHCHDHTHDNDFDAAGMAFPSYQSDMVNLASVMPGWADGPEMRQLQDALRAADEADPAPLAPVGSVHDHAGPVVAAAGRYSGGAVASAAAVGGAIGSFDAAAKVAQHGNYSPLPAASGESESGSTGGDTAGGSVSGGGGGAASTSCDSYADDDYARKRASGQAAAAGGIVRRAAAQGASTATSGDGSVRVSLSMPFPAGLMRAAAAMPVAAGTSFARTVSKQSTALSDGDTQAGYGGGGAGAGAQPTASQHREEHYVNWMANSGAYSSRALAQSALGATPRGPTAHRGAAGGARPTGSVGDSINQPSAGTEEGARPPPGVWLGRELEDDGCSCRE